jgi:3-deoxy-D-manno-octulosonic-acid transferase
LVIYINVTTKRKFSLKNLDAKFEELGNRGVFTLGKMKRGSQSKIELHHNRYQGRVEIGEDPSNKQIRASAWGNEEERLASSWIEWMIRYFSSKIAVIEVFPDEAKVGKE